MYLLAAAEWSDPRPDPLFCESLAQTIQPWAALVVRVTVRPEVELTVPVSRLPPKLSVFPLNAKVNVAPTAAVTTIWSSEITEVAYCEESIVAGTLVRVVTEPDRLLLVDPGVVRVLVAAKLKQYSVAPFAKSVLGKVTVCPATAVAVPIPGQAVWPESKPVVVTVQLLAVVLSVKPVGNVTWTLATVEATVPGDAHTLPPVADDVVIRSKRTITLARPAASTGAATGATSVPTMPVIASMASFRFVNSFIVPGPPRIMVCKIQTYACLLPLCI
jgi:hypothetical protein